MRTLRCGSGGSELVSLTTRKDRENEWMPVLGAAILDSRPRFLLAATGGVNSSVGERGGVG